MVTSGQFLIDSEASLKTALKRLEGAEEKVDVPAKEGAIGKTHRATGTVNNLDREAGSVNLSHGPVPSLNWPAMTMGLPPSLAQYSDVCRLCVKP